MHCLRLEYYSTLLQVQHVGGLMEDTLYIPCNCYESMSTACGHACTRYEVYKVRAIYWHFQTFYLNFVVSSSPGILISSRRCPRCIVYFSGTLIYMCRILPSQSHFQSLKYCLPVVYRDQNFVPAGAGPGLPSSLPGPG